MNTIFANFVNNIFFTLQEFLDQNILHIEHIEDIEHIEHIEDIYIHSKTFKRQYNTMNWFYVVFILTVTNIVHQAKSIYLSQYPLKCNLACMAINIIIQFM